MQFNLVNDQEQVAQCLKRFVARVFCCVLAQGVFGQF